MGADSVVNTLATAWKLIKDNEPTAEIASTTCNAVPHVDDWQDLGHALGPTLIGKLPIRNISPLGFTNVECDLDVVYQYGATYKGGGAFIPGLWITVEKCEVAWLFSLDVSLQVKTLTNANPGTPSPIAQMTLQISWHITNHLASESKSADFTVWGDGRQSVVHKY